MIIKTKQNKHSKTVYIKEPDGIERRYTIGKYKTRVYTKEPKSNSEMIFVYDNNDREIYRMLNSNESFYEMWFQYDSRGNRVSHKSFDGRTMYSEICRYDSKNRKIYTRSTEKTHPENVRIFSCWQKYNDCDQQIYKRTITVENGIREEIIRKCDDLGRVIYKKNVPKKIVSYYEYETTEDGHLKTIIKTVIDGRIHTEVIATDL